VASPQGGRLSVSPDQRDLLYERIYRNLAGIDFVWEAAREEEFDKANRLGLKYCDELTLVIEDLGWGDRSSDRPIELKTPPEVFRRVLERLRSEAEELEPVIDVRGAAEENRRLLAACEELLKTLTAYSLKGEPREDNASRPKGGEK
jgi:hypothetical protein